MNRDTEELGKWEIGDRSQLPHSYTFRMIFVANIGSNLLDSIFSFQSNKMLICLGQKYHQLKIVAFLDSLSAEDSLLM